MREVFMSGLIIKKTLREDLENYLKIKQERKSISINQPKKLGNALFYNSSELVEKLYSDEKSEALQALTDLVFNPNDLDFNKHMACLFDILQKSNEADSSYKIFNNSLSRYMPLLNQALDNIIQLSPDTTVKPNMLTEKEAADVRLKGEEWLKLESHFVAIYQEANALASWLNNSNNKIDANNKDLVNFFKNIDTLRNTFEKTHRYIVHVVDYFKVTNKIQILQKYKGLQGPITYTIFTQQLNDAKEKQNPFIDFKQLESDEFLSAFKKTDSTNKSKKIRDNALLDLLKDEQTYSQLFTTSIIELSFLPELLKAVKSQTLQQHEYQFLTHFANLCTYLVETGFGQLLPKQTEAINSESIETQIRKRYSTRYSQIRDLKKMSLLIIDNQKLRAKLTPDLTTFINKLSVFIDYLHDKMKIIRNSLAIEQPLNFQIDIKMKDIIALTALVNKNLTSINNHSGNPELLEKCFAKELEKEVELSEITDKQDFNFILKQSQYYHDFIVQTVEGWEKNSDLSLRSKFSFHKTLPITPATLKETVQKNDKLLRQLEDINPEHRKHLKTAQ